MTSEPSQNEQYPPYPLRKDNGIIDIDTTEKVISSSNPLYALAQQILASQTVQKIIQILPK